MAFKSEEENYNPGGVLELILVYHQKYDLKYELFIIFFWFVLSWNKWKNVETLFI